MCEALLVQEGGDLDGPIVVSREAGAAVAAGPPYGASSTVAFQALKKKWKFVYRKNKPKMVNPPEGLQTF